MYIYINVFFVDVKIVIYLFIFGRTLIILKIEKFFIFYFKNLDESIKEYIILLFLWMSVCC